MDGRTAVRAIAVLALVMLLAGCGLRIPTDPGGALDRIDGGSLRVGAVLEPGLVELEAGEPAGALADLVLAFAAEHDADVEWTTGSEETLVGGLEDGRLDLVIGGMTAETPWVDRAGVSRAYPGIPGAGDRELVVLVPAGENRLLAELEGFLDRELAP